MEKLKVLFICPQPLWPTNTGARLRNFHLASVLCGHCEVTVLQAIDHSVPLAPPPADSAFLTVLSVARDKGYTPLKMIRGLTGPLPLTVLNYLSQDIEAVLTRTLASTAFDIIQIESIHMAPYFRKLAKPPLLVLDWHNIESELMLRFGQNASNPAKKLVAARTAKLLHNLEQTALETFSAHTVVSELERDKLLKRAPAARIFAIPNGVDTASFAPAVEKPVSQTLLFVGSMDYHANAEAVLWFCRDIWPRIAAEFPHLNFKIVGRNPPPSVQALASSRVIVTGTVDDVRPYYHEAFAVVVPLRVGGGTRLKILEAMAAGVPVISTRLGAQGITAEHHKNILLADTAVDMAAAVRELIGQPALAQQLQQSARELVLAHYDWSALGQQLATVYRNLKVSWQQPLAGQNS